MYKEINGNLISMALAGAFDVIAHGCNTFCVQGAGIALQMRKTFGTNMFRLERGRKGDIDKLGRVDFQGISLPVDLSRPPFCEGFVTYPKYEKSEKILYVCNLYTQYNYGRNHEDGDEIPISYEATAMCMYKMNKIFKGKHIGLPQISAGLGGGDWNRIKAIIQEQLKDVDVTVVIYDGK